MNVIEFTKKDLQYDLIGKHVTEAVVILRRKDIDYRILDKNSITDCLFMPDRLNLVLDENRTVKDAYIG